MYALAGGIFPKSANLVFNNFAVHVFHEGKPLYVFAKLRLPVFSEITVTSIGQGIEKLDRRRLTLFLRLDYAQLNENNNFGVSL